MRFIFSSTYCTAVKTTAQFKTILNTPGEWTHFYSAILQDLKKSGKNRKRKRKERKNQLFF